ncbi:hypothetical protein BB8028_0009g01860 [Beauveria bassiana]|uniref:C2H2-type domain-containing protein n=1 Tax=Beauveria bassiana TaxID=176275 RepID=A0A2S7YP74_BEABA|nr:hypothetical protein BB8028_0009g01860 [Beauveria bassiana]
MVAIEFLLNEDTSSTAAMPYPDSQHQHHNRCMEPAGKRRKLAPKLNASASFPSGPRSKLYQHEPGHIVPDAPHHSRRHEFEALKRHLHDAAMIINRQTSHLSTSYAKVSLLPESLSDAATPEATRTRGSPHGLTPGSKLTFDEARVLVCTTFVGNTTPDMSDFHSWLWNTPSLAAQTTIEGIFLGPPTVLLLSMSTSLWASVQHDKIWNYLGNITSCNLASLYSKMVGAPATSTAVTEPSTATTMAPEAAKDERPDEQTSPTAEIHQSWAANGLEQLKALSHVRHRSGDAAVNTSPQRAILPVAMPALHPGFRNLTRSEPMPVLDSGTGSTGARMRRMLGKPDIRCAHCSHTPFKDASSLRKHIAAAHTRPFPCAFYFAGCTSIFGSKNEWKRHIASQHLCLQYYRCSICSQTTSEGKDIEFNRKDLFTQHLRRMHAPFKRDLTRGENGQQQSERNMQQACLKQRRRPPQRSSCPKSGCVKTFEGPTAWDEWTAHVGRHMEKGEGENLGVDDLLLRYALDEGIIERVGDKGYQLCKSHTSLREGEP